MPSSDLLEFSASTSVAQRLVTRRMLHTRTLEIAVRAGRTPPYVTQADYEQAKRELTGFAEVERQDAMIAPA